jgi:type IV secretion system protein VirB6
MQRTWSFKKMKLIRKYTRVFLFLVSAIVVAWGCNADPAQNFISQVQTALGANCPENISCSMMNSSDNGQSPIYEADPISLNFLSLISGGFQMVSYCGDNVGNCITNQEGVYITCNETNDQLQSCLYGSTNGKDTFSVTTDYRAATPNPNLRALDAGGNLMVDSNGNPLYCPLTRCDIVTGEMLATLNLNGVTYTINAPVGGAATQVVPSLGLKGIGEFRAINIGTPETGMSTCLALQGAQGYVYLGCKTPIAQNTPAVPGSPCNMNSGTHSRSFFSISGRVIECVQDMFASVFNPCGSSCTNNIFQEFQDAMQSIVRAALIIYVIVFGINVSISMEVPKKSEILLAMWKIILVMYFSVGLEFNGSNSSGMIDFVYPLLKAAMSSFAEFVFGSIGTFCNYTTDMYSPAEYSYLALWDSLDCRVGYYLGFYSIFNPNANAIYGILSLIFPLIFALKFLAVAFMICLGIFILSIVVYFVHVYILALLGLTIMVYLSPIFVPFALFEKTKGFFEGWKNLLISYTVQPTVITAFLAVMLAVFDQIIFGTCFTTPGDVTQTSLNGNPYWIINNTTKDPGCLDSFGYLLNSAQPNTVDLLFFTVSIFSSGDGAFFTALVESMIFAFIFFFFSESLGEFAAELTGGSNLSSMAITPTKVMKEAAGRMYKKVFEKVGVATGVEGVTAAAAGKDGGDKGGGKGA